MSESLEQGHEYLGISLIRVVKELAGRVRLLEEVVRSNPELSKTLEKQLGYRAAYEEDEYQRLIEKMQSVLDVLPGLEIGDE